MLLSNNLLIFLLFIVVVTFTTIVVIFILLSDGLTRLHFLLMELLLSWQLCGINIIVVLAFYFFFSLIAH